jgi:hypothetical protein
MKIQTLILATGASLVFGMSSCTTIAPPAAKGSVDHVVLVWLKRPGNPADRQALLDAGRELRSIPGLQFLDQGLALPSARPMVDDSFDVGYVMRFDSPAAMENYAKHSLHERKVTEVLKPLSRKIVVYDITR